MKTILSLLVVLGAATAFVAVVSAAKCTKCRGKCRVTLRKLSRIGSHDVSVLLGTDTHKPFVGPR